MLGRLIVGPPTGPGNQPFDWYSGRPEAKDWVLVPPAARAAFPTVKEIMRSGRVPAKMIAKAQWRNGVMNRMQICACRS
jgi:hypothetical protein